MDYSLWRKCIQRACHARDPLLGCNGLVALLSSNLFPRVPEHHYSWLLMKSLISSRILVLLTTRAMNLEVWSLAMPGACPHLFHDTAAPSPRVQEATFPT